MRSRFAFVTAIPFLALFLAGLLAAPRLATAEPTSAGPAWLSAHVGYGDGQIAPIVLQRARGLYLQSRAKASLGTIATSPWTRRARTIWEALPDAGFTLSAKTRACFAPFRPDMAGSRFARRRQFCQRTGVRQEFRQCGGVGSDGWRGLCDGGNEDVVQRLLSCRGT